MDKFNMNVIMKSQIITCIFIKIIFNMTKQNYQDDSYNANSCYEDR